MKIPKPRNDCLSSQFGQKLKNIVLHFCWTYGSYEGSFSCSCIPWENVTIKCPTVSSEFKDVYENVLCICSLCWSVWLFIFSIDLARLLKNNLFSRVPIFSNLANSGTLQKKRDYWDFLFRTQLQKATPSRKVFETYLQKRNKHETFERNLIKHDQT